MELKMLLPMLLAVPVIAMAGVNPRNGSFYITYNDISLKNGGHELEIVRTYNSKASDVGWFGYGWGSKYESRLVVLPDGTAAIRENGTGRTNYYRSNSEGNVSIGIKRIVAAATARDNLSQASADELATKLLNDEDLRINNVIKYQIHTELPNGASLDDFCGKGSLIRIKDGYQRSDCNRFGDSDPATDFFDLKGRLIRHELKDGYAVTIRYTDVGTAEIRDTLGQSIALTWTTSGRVASAKTKDALVKYTYDKLDLVNVVEKSGNSYRHHYDANHNLTRIVYVDDSSIFISYSPKLNGMAGSVTDRNGDQQTFVYRTDPQNANHYWTKHTIISKAGKTASREYEYEDQVSSTGATHLAQAGQIGDGQPANTKFDSQGRIIRKSHGNGEFTDYSYDPSTGKLVSISSKNFNTYFQYDLNENLTCIENSDGQVISLEYDSSKLIQRMIDVNNINKTRHQLTFKYDKNGRPIEIALAGTGKINVKYNGNGEIISVASDQGAEVALKVSAAFENLRRTIAAASGEAPDNDQD